MSDSPFHRSVARFCVGCQSSLPQAEKDSECVDCGHPFDPGDARTFRRHRRRSGLRYWMPAFCLAVCSGVISYAACLQFEDMGFGLFVGVPVSVGAIIGYGTRASTLGFALMGLMAAVTIVGALLCGGLAGVFCGLTLLLVLLLPLILGIVAGRLLSFLLSRTRWDQRWFLPMLLFIALPYAIQMIESWTTKGTEVEVVRTSLHMHATPQEAWNAIVFYEQVEHSPPWLLRLALPIPLRSEGDKRREGEIVRCFYDRGWLSKRISRVEPHRRLSFEVIEQKLHFERDLQLLNGSFEIQPAAEGGSRVELTTRYRRKLAPRAVWLPIERSVIHTLHRHVLEGMRRKAERREEPNAPPPSDEPLVDDRWAIRVSRRRWENQP